MTHKWIATGLAAGLFLLLVFGLAGLAAGVNGDFSVYLPLLRKPVAAPTPTPTATATSTPMATATATSTPTATATTGPPPAGNVKIADIFYDGVKGSQEPDEYVEIHNSGSGAVQLEGWTLRDAASTPHVFTFPNFLMQPGQTCRVYTNEFHEAWCGFSYGSGSAIWNNTGDCAYLRDSGGLLVDSYCY
jgi:hypothetical protein